MAIPDFPALRLEVLKLAAEGEIRYVEATKQLADRLQLTEEERRATLEKSKSNRFMNRVNWAKVYLGQAGLIKTTKRGFFVITEEGRNVLSSAPQEISRDFLRQYPSFRAFMGRVGASKRRSKDSQSSVIEDEWAVEQSPEDLITSAYQEIEAELASQLLDAVLNGSPEFFEQLIVDLMLKMGYGGAFGNGEQIGGAGDGGLDGLIEGDALGLDRVYLQAKRYKADNIVGPDAVRGFFGALTHAGAGKGVFITTSRFTAAAQDFADRANSARLVLIDGEELVRLMIKYNVGVRKDRVVELKKIDQDYFEDG